MIDKKTETLIEQITNRLKDDNVSDGCIKDVTQMICTTYEYTEHYGRDIIRYAEKKYYEFYADSAVEFRKQKVTDAKLLTNIATFRDNNNIDLSGHKKFCDWLLENVKTIYGRQMIIYDIVDYRLYEKYIKDGGEEKQVIKKRNFNKKMFHRRIR